MSTEISCDKPFEDGDRANVFFIGDGLPLSLSSYLQLWPSVALYRSLACDPNCFLMANSPDVGAPLPNEQSGRPAGYAFRSLDAEGFASPLDSRLHPLDRLPANMVVHVFGAAFSSTGKQSEAFDLAERLIDRHAAEHQRGSRVLLFSGVSDVAALRVRTKLLESSSYIGVADADLLRQFKDGAAQYSGPDSVASLSKLVRRGEPTGPVVICDLDIHGAAREELIGRMTAASAAAIDHYAGQVRCDVLVGAAASSRELDRFCAEAEQRWNLRIHRRNLLQDMLSGASRIECSLLVTSCVHMAILGLFLECPTLLIATPETLAMIPAELANANRHRLQVSLSDDGAALRALLQFNGEDSGVNPVVEMLAAQSDRALNVAKTYFHARAALDKISLQHCTAAFGQVSSDLAELRLRVVAEDRLRARSRPAATNVRALNYWQRRKQKLLRSIGKRLQAG